MTKKEYIDSHEMNSIHSVTAWLGYACHGVEYGIDDYAYISTIVNGEIDSYHKVKIYYDPNGRAYMFVNGVKLWADDFLRV